MRTLLVAAFGAMLLVGAGCQNKDESGMKRSGSMKSDSMSKTSMRDDCPHCPGNQIADANGRCPVCHMKVASSANQ
jgi:hypothetical protein